MFFVTDNVHGLPNERMKWVGDHHLVRQIIRVLQRKLYREAKDELTLRDDACGQ